MKESKRAKPETRRGKTPRSPRRNPGASATGINGGDEDALAQERRHEVQLEAQNEELRLVREQLEEAKAKYEDLFRHAPMAYLVLDLEGNVLEVNRSAATLLERSGLPLEGCSFAKVVEETDRAAFRAYIRGLTEQGERRTCELRLRGQNGPFLARLEAAVVPHAGRTWKEVRLAVVDMSAQRTQEARAKSGLEQVALLYELSEDGIAITRKGGRFLQVNPAACRILGYSEQELLSMTAYDLQPAPGEPSMETQLAPFLTGQHIRGEFQFLRPDGERRTVEFSARRFGEDEFVSIFRDITERKQAEEQLRLYSEHLEELVERRAERILELERHRADGDKLAATGRMAARIAHEINNPLAGIKNAFLLIKDAVDPSYPYYRYVGSIQKEIDRIARIVSQMFDLYQPDREQPQRFNLNEVVEDVVLMLEPLSRQHQVTVRTRLPAFPVILFQPEGLVRQVLYNIIANAIEASPPDTEVKVNAALTGEKVSVSVVDRGPGITEEVASRLFEPFFTTKTGRYDEGIGLGLSVSRTLVELMQGTLTYQSKVGEGTVFRAELPQTSPVHRAE